MYEMLVRLAILATMAEVGFTAFSKSTSSMSFSQDSMRRAQRKVLRVDWKPISIFPKEAKKFR